MEGENIVKKSKFTFAWLCKTEKEVNLPGVCSRFWWGCFLTSSFSSDTIVLSFTDTSFEPIIIIMTQSFMGKA